jgi:anti-sigma regulatory factor (Ser/Thr protein kinase)
MSRTQLDDVALLVTEMVTNSVRHAGVGPHANVGVELLVFADRLRVVVVDPGSTRVPRLVRRLADEPRGIGLLVVDRVSISWGVARDGAGVTRTWCDVPLQPAAAIPAGRPWPPPGSAGGV